MQEKEKAKRIVDELLTYFFTNQINEIRIGLDFIPEGFYVEMQGKSETEPEDIWYLLELLNTPRDTSLEADYEELLGVTHHEEKDYLLLGSMIDEAEISYDSPIFDIKVFRKKN